MSCGSKGKNEGIIMKMCSQELLDELDKEIKVGTEIPKTREGARPVTKKEGDRIWMRTGVQTKAKKYITKEMVLYAFEVIQSGKPFTWAGLKGKFPEECGQGGCVFSMTGGILVLFRIARYIQGKGYIAK